MKREDDDRPLFTDEQFGVALADLTARGMVEWEGDENLRLTNKGIDRGLELKDKLGGSDWLVLILFMDRISQVTPVEGDDS